jgi:flagellar protein FlbD
LKNHTQLALLHRSPCAADEVDRAGNKAKGLGDGEMIELTRLNGSPLFVNSDLIKWAEAAPDTMLTLISGEKVVVREACAEVIRRMVAQRVAILAAVGRQTHEADILLRASTAVQTPEMWIESSTPQAVVTGGGVAASD